MSIEDVTVHRGAAVLRDISLELPAGKTLAVVGESGAGKSTLIAAILGLVKLFAGSISWSGAPVASCRVAFVMQEPRAAFNPRLSLRQSVMEPARAQKTSDADARLARLCAGLEIPPEILERRPGDVSIGQAQRVGILRALIAAPPLVLFDEPLSALDSVTQKQTASLVSELQAEQGFAALIVTHDLGYAVAHADQIAVLKEGRLEAKATPEAFLQGLDHAYCRQLRDAAYALGGLEMAH